VEVHELVGWPAESNATLAWRTSFESALQAYRNRDFAAAERGFRETMVIRLDDGPSTFYLHLMKRLEGQALPLNWNGDIELTEK
jgi:hypothetical protein